MNLRSGKTYNYFEKCNNCQTLNKVMKRQAKADRAVSCGQISEGEYLMLSNIAKELYEWLTESCDCLEPEDDHRELEDDGVIIDVHEVTIQGRVVLQSTEPVVGNSCFTIYDRETCEEIGYAIVDDEVAPERWEYYFD
jgi:hypothetical protein